MSNQKTYSFLIKFLLSVLTFLGISLLVNSFFSGKDKDISVSIPYLNLPNHLADSLISLMTVDEKLNLIIQFKKNSATDSLSSQEMMSVNISDSFANNTAFGGKDAPEEIKEGDSKYQFEFNELTNYNYFNAISDTAFLKSYLTNSIEKSDFAKKSYHFIPFDVQELNHSTDSDYMVFYTKRLKLYKQIFRKNNSLFGIAFNGQVLKQIDSLRNDSNFCLKEFYEILKNDLDFVVIDSLKNGAEIPFDFQGIVVAKFVDILSMPDESLVKLMNSNIDLLFLQLAEKNKIKYRIKKLLDNQQLNETVLNTKLKKIIKAWIWTTSKVPGKSMGQAVNTRLLEQQLIEKSICLISNPDSVIPVKYIHNKRFMVVWIGDKMNKIFLDFTEKYVSKSVLHLKMGEDDWEEKLKYSQNRSFIIYVLDAELKDSADIQQFNAIKHGMQGKSSVLVNISNYRNLKFFPDTLACIQTQSNSASDYKFTAQAIFGGISTVGQLPFTVSVAFQFGLSNTSAKIRLKYTIPEDAGLDPEKLKQIERIAHEGINAGAFPGCQVFVAKEGKVVFNKSFGYHTYSSRISVKDDDVYDLASVTKIAATTIAAMKMISDNKMSLNQKLGKFFKNTAIDYTRIRPDTLVKIDTFYNSSIEDWKTFLKQNDTLNLNDTSFITRDTIITKLTPRQNIFKISLIDLLRHKSGIVPAMPVFRYIYYKAYFVKQLKEQLAAIHGKTGPVFDYRSFNLPAAFPDNTNLSDSLKHKIKEGFKKQYDEYFSKTYKKDTSDIELLKGLYFKNRYFDTIWRDTKQLPVFSRKVFEYSDVNMILIQLAIDSLNRKPINEFMKKSFYKQLGLKTTTYLPLNYYGKYKVIPTEFDNSWRYGNLNGYVQDPSAALMGGIAGNAGLYSNAHDLGVLFQMVLNKGSYGGIQYLNSNVIERFTKRQDDTQRALGFDMPNRKAKVGSRAPKRTYGHSGYTGTCVWVDPDNQIVYVFLSNRNNTSSNNWLINKYHIRERIHNVVYDAIIVDNDSN